MSKLQRVTGILAGIISIATGIFLIIAGDEWIEFVILLLSVTFLTTGLGTLTYFFSMARYMVGGLKILIRGMILLDFALITASLADVPTAYIMIYLLFIHAFSGLVDILRGLEARRYHASSWRFTFLHGIFSIVLAFICILNLQSPATATIIYGGGLVYSGVSRILAAVRRNAIVYVQ